MRNHQERPTGNHQGRPTGPQLINNGFTCLLKSGRAEELDRSIFQRPADDTTNFVHFRGAVKLNWTYWGTRLVDSPRPAAKQQILRSFGFPFFRIPTQCQFPCCPSFAKRHPSSDKPGRLPSCCPRTSGCKRFQCRTYYLLVRQGVHSTVDKLRSLVEPRSNIL